MNSNFNYNGIVTLKMKYKDRVIHTQHFNSGTDTLLKAYSKALAGYDIKSFLPSYFNIGYMEGDSFITSMTPSIGASVIRSYVEDGSKPDGSFGCTRISVTLSRNMVDANKLNDKNVRFTLNSSPQLSMSDGETLATVDLDDADSTSFVKMLRSTTSGTQLIIVWDLYVVNGKEGNSNE